MKTVSYHGTVIGYDLRKEFVAQLSEEDILYL
jgi:hypothetical protein